MQWGFRSFADASNYHRLWFAVNWLRVLLRGRIVRMTVAIVVAAMTTTGISIGLAAPASAGCEPRPLVSYCDKPVRADGSWRRCFWNGPLTDGNGGIGFAGGGKC